MSRQIWDTPEWASLKSHVGDMESSHLRDLLKVGNGVLLHSSWCDVFVWIGISYSLT